MGAAISSTWHNLTKCKNTKQVKASQRVHPCEPEGEAKNETVNPGNLAKDLEAGNNQERAPPNEINKMTVAAPPATTTAATTEVVSAITTTTTTTTTTTDTDKDDADYVFKISSPLITTSSSAILLISNMANPLPMDVLFMFALVDLFSGFSLLCLVCRDKREMVMLSKFLCCSGFLVMFFAIGSVVVRMLPYEMLLCLGIVSAVIIMLATVAWRFTWKGKMD
ncbi:hypothetical protein QJS04_geneDACA013335 [Acorus gramineus]|uniref:NADH dehydrogenase subunit 6 n=1 Tax=Acorus gramineus TaxID=55184 RepID=A0AAV9AA51_ACOGR|nr:hypothetical protein QJS04_geneDACA013335 [Acorus gramineus]